MDDRLPESLEWWNKAIGDAEAARILIREKGPGFAIGFHMQQAIEKALKALLTLNNLQFPRTHDLEVLANTAIPFLPSLSRFTDLRARLNEFAVIARYPGDAPKVPHHELDEWLKETAALLDEIESILRQEEKKPEEEGEPEKPKDQGPEGL